MEEWTRGKEGNVRAMLATLHEVLWEGTTWKRLGLQDVCHRDHGLKMYISDQLFAKYEHVLYKVCVRCLLHVLIFLSILRSV